MILGQENNQTISLIGSQIWMSKNLDAERFKNGDKIYFAKSLKKMNNLKKKGKPAWCYYNFDSKNRDKYGKLYNWKAVTDPRGLAPEGWHIPTKDEWLELSKFLGDNGGEKLKAKNGWENFSWDNEIENSNGSDLYNFEALPGGGLDINGNFNGLGFIGNWWTCTQNKTDYLYNYFYIQSTNKKLNSLSDYDGLFLSVRCVRN